MDFPSQVKSQLCRAFPLSPFFASRRISIVTDVFRRRDGSQDCHRLEGAWACHCELRNLYLLNPCLCPSRLDRQLLLWEPIMTISACWSLLFGFGPDHARINPCVEHLGQVLYRASRHTVDRILTNVFRLHPYHLVLVGCITVLFVHLPDVKSFQHKLQNNSSIG